MTTPAQPTTDPVLARIVRDHEKRIRKVERILWAVAGAASGSTGTWLGIMMSRR